MSTEAQRDTSLANTHAIADVATGVEPRPALEPGQPAAAGVPAGAGVASTSVEVRAGSPWSSPVVPAAIGAAAVAVLAGLGIGVERGLRRRRERNRPVSRLRRRAESALPLGLLRSALVTPSLVARRWPGFERDLAELVASALEAAAAQPQPALRDARLVLAGIRARLP
jgi:hypothetical protein